MLYSKLTRLIKRKISQWRSRPKRLAVELTNRCNLNCPFCLVGLQDNQDSVAHDALQRDRGRMKLELAGKVIKDAKDFGMTEILLTFQGEPLLHSEILDFIGLCKKYQMKSILFTNGMLLNPAKSYRLIHAGLDSIQFSVDGATQEVYSQNRVGGNFDTVFKNMRDIVTMARNHKSDMSIVWQFIVLRNNEHQVELAKQLADEIGIRLILKTFAESVPELAPLNEKYRRNLQMKPCTDIYRCPAVLWNGDVVPCCYDIEGKEVMGNIRNTSFLELWKSERYCKFRDSVSDVLNFPENDPGLCKTCLKWKQP